MPKIQKTTKNPHGLSPKQLLVIEDMAAKVKRGESIKPVESTMKIYDVTKKSNASSISSINMSNPDFRAALLEKISAGELYSGDSVIDRKLREGLEATSVRQEVIDYDSKGKPVTVYVKDTDYKTRLAYIQELNKIAGVYAPEKKETRSLKLKVDLTEEELDEKISALKEELSM